jgi:HEAT repeat protein
MAKKTTKTGKALEKRVADAYRAIGARKVEHDVELAGHQIDVYVGMETGDRALHRIAVEAKDRARPVGKGIVSDFAKVVEELRRLGHVDQGVIVSAHGFTRPGRNLAKEEGLRLLEPADLEAMAERPDLEQMRADYLASLRQRFEYLDLGGIAPRVQNRTVKLRMEDVFVPVQARPELESRAEWLVLSGAEGPDLMAEMPEGAEGEEMALRMMARRERAVEAQPVDIPELLRRPRVVVLGDPGSGKSTLLRHVAYAVACGKVGAVGEATLERLPILVRIAPFSQAQAEDHTLTLDTYVRRVCEPKWAPLFQHVLDTGGALVLLDGLDEVVDAHQRKGIAEAIQTLAADYPGNAFLVTSRVVGYQAARLSGDFAHHTIQPLPLARIAEFVEKWYTAIEREAGEAELAEEARARAEELSRVIQERPGIQRLAENPLLLTIIALVNWRGRKLPNRRVELYAHAAETLIESWPYRRQGVKLDTERVIRLLSPVAYRIFATSPSGDIAEDELLPILTEAICRVDGVDERTATAYANEFLSQISEHSGIFRERGYDERGRRVFGFLHLTFAEYFTARYLAGLWEGIEDDDTRRALLRKYAHVPRWREVVLLLAGDVGLRDNDRAERATRLLGDVLMLGGDYEDKLHRDLLLAGECLADDLRVQSQAARYVLDGLLKLALEPGVGDVIQDIFRAMRETAYGQFVLVGLLARLEDEDSRVRRRAALALGRLGDARAVEGLLARLEDEDGRVRGLAAEALGCIDDARAVEGLLTVLEDGDEDEWVQARAARGLGALGDRRAVEVLLARLRYGSHWVRGRAAGMLGALGDKRVVETLLAQLEDEDRHVRANVAGALGKLGDQRAVKALLTRLEDEDGGVQAMAAEALGQLGDVRAVEALLVQLEEEYWSVRSRAARALGALDDMRAVEPLLARLEDEDEWVRASAAGALGKLGDALAVEPLLARLQDESRWVRSSAAMALGELGDERTVGPLLVRLEDEGEWVRAIAAWALGALGDVRAVEPLLARLEEDEDKRVRHSAAEALGRLGDARAVEPLLARLEDEDWDVRKNAYKALVAILNRNAREPEPEEVACQPQAVPGPWDT